MKSEREIIAQEETRSTSKELKRKELDGRHI